MNADALTDDQALELLITKNNILGPKLSEFLRTECNALFPDDPRLAVALAGTALLCFYQDLETNSNGTLAPVVMTYMHCVGRD